MPLKLKTCLVAILCVSCQTHAPVRMPGVEVKLYTVQPDDLLCPKNIQGQKEPWCANKSGLFRPKHKEFLSLDESKGFIAMPFDDFLKLINSCPN